jgi:transglutaminase-like putative cysteine protease
MIPRATVSFAAEMLFRAASACWNTPSSMPTIHTPPTRWPDPGPAYLESATYIDSDSPRLREFAEWAIAGEASDIGRAARLFYRVRDGWRYDPFSIRLEPEHYVASRILESSAAYCLPKAILLAALARAVGIPSAIGLADVKNHLTTKKLRQRMGGKDLFIHHGFAVLRLDGKWVKAAPAFNIELCERFGVRPTEFDGRSDAVFQEFDMINRRHMEYVCDHGTWSDFPYDRVMADFRAFYPVSTYTDAADERFEDGVPVK